MASNGSSATSPAPVLLDVVEEHLDELAFLSLQRRKTLFHSESGSNALRRLGRRIEAHWDALAIAGAPAISLAQSRLDSDDPWDLYAAAHVLLAYGGLSSEGVLGHLEHAEGSAAAAWREALRRTTSPLMTSLESPASLASAPAAAQSALVYAAGWHGTLPAPLIPRLAASDDGRVRWSLARVLANPAFQRVAGPVLTRLATDADLAVRRAALWSRALIDPANVGREPGRLARGERDGFAVRAFALLAGTAATRTLLDWLAQEGPRVEVVLAVGDAGDTSAMEALLGLLESADADVAAAATQAIEVIVGRIAPARAPPPDTDDEPRVLDANSARAWWSEHARAFSPDVRWLRGRRLDDPDLRTLESEWRRALLSPTGDAVRLEIPDGFFTGLPCLQAMPGE